MDPVQQFLIEHFADENGVIYTDIDPKTLRKMEDDFFPADLAMFNWEKDSPTPAEFWAYENCGMTTGGYLSALCTMLSRPENKDDTVLKEQAQRTFKALQHIYKIGSQWEEGFFPKIWGNKFSHQTSTDQYLYALFSMDEYYVLASEEEQALIRKMIPAMVRFWSKRKYTLTYYHVNDMVWPPLRFPSFLLLACKYVPEEERASLAEEGLRILAENLHKIPENSRRKSGRLFHLADAVTMDVMNIILMLESDFLPDSYRDTLLSGMEKMWVEARQTLAEDGFYYSSMPCDRESGIVTPGTVAQYGPRSGWSSMVVRAGLQMSRYLPHLKEEAIHCAQRVMEKLTPGTMYYYHPDDADKMEEKDRFKTKFLSGDSIVNYVWAQALLKDI